MKKIRPLSELKLFHNKPIEPMPTCDQTNEPLTSLTRSLFNTDYKELGWPFTECSPPQPIKMEVEFIDETKVKIDGVLYTPTINGEWVDLKEIGIPGAISLGRQCHMNLLSWEEMMELYNEGQTIFQIQTNG